MTRGGAATAVAALLVALALAPATAQAQTRPAAQLSLASQTPWVRSTTAFTIRLDVDRVRRPDRLELDIAVHRAVTSRSQFARTLDGDLLGSTVHTDRVPFAQLRFDAGGAIPITISDTARLREGVYPVSLDLVDVDTDEPVASLVTHLIRVPDEEVELPLRVAWVQPYGADPALHPSGDVSISDGELDELRTIAAELDDDVPMTVTPTPETIEAIAALDDGRSAAALARLLQGHQVVSGTYVDVDPSALVAAGLGDDLGRQRVEGDRVLREVLGITGDNRTASLSGPITRGGLRALAEVGVSRVIVDEEALERLDADATGGLTLTRPFSLAATGSTALDAVAVDPGIVAHFDGRDDVLAAHHLLADLAVLHFDSPGTLRGVVVRPPADWQPSDVLLATALVDLASSPVLQPVTVDDLLADVEPLVDDDGDPVERELAGAEAAGLGVTAEDIEAVRAEMGGYASLLVEPAGDGLALLDRFLLAAESDDLTPPSRTELLDAVRAHIRDATANVRVLGDRTYRLTAREGTIPLTLVNDNPFPVRVEVALTSDKLTFTDSNTEGRLEITDLVLDANETTTRAIPVKARTSGAFPMRVTIRSPDHRLEIGASRFTITSTVASGVGLVLSAGAALFLLLWWGSHWRTVRRARRLVPAE